MRYVLAITFLSCIPAANWMIGHVGTTCLPQGPCLVPVAPGIMAPSGVLVVGLALVLRSLLQEAAGRRWVVACIAIGAAVSAAVAPPHLVMASAAAFMCGEVVDWLVYSPLRQHGWTVALVAAGLAGSVVDSVLFLGLAFGSLSLAAGQIIGKTWASLFAGIAMSRLSQMQLRR